MTVFIRSQAGFTLTGLMISIVLVQVVVLISLRLQSVHHRSVDDIRVSTIHNRVLTTALTVALKEIKSAGYGIADAGQNDIFTRNPTGTPATHSIHWRYQLGTTAVCKGLRESGVTIAGTDYRQLDLISEPNCDLTSGLQTFAWNTVDATIGLWEIDSLLQNRLDNVGTLFQFQNNPGDCTVPGLGDPTPQQHQIVTVSVPNTAELNGNSVPSNEHNVCLINL